MAGGWKTAQAYATPQERKAAQKQTRILSADFGEKAKKPETISDNPLDDVDYKIKRRKRLMDRIRSEEAANGIQHPEDKEDTFDRWVQTGALKNDL